jgi:hypothetical protein
MTCERRTPGKITGTQSRFGNEIKRLKTDDIGRQLLQKR